MADERIANWEKKNEGLDDELWWHWRLAQEGEEELVGGHLNLLGQGAQVGVQLMGGREGKVEEEMKKLGWTGTEGEGGWWAASLGREVGFGGVGGHQEEVVEECRRAIPH